MDQINETELTERIDHFLFGYVDIVERTLNGKTSAEGFADLFLVLCRSVYQQAEVSNVCVEVN